LQQRDVLKSPQAVRDYLVLKLGSLTKEVFLVLFLETQNHLVAIEEMFSSSLKETSVY
jgi:DNA repair protein RadC